MGPASNHNTPPPLHAAQVRGDFQWNSSHSVNGLTLHGKMNSSHAQGQGQEWQGANLLLCTIYKMHGVGH